MTIEQKIEFLLRYHESLLNKMKADVMNGIGRDRAYNRMIKIEVQLDILLDILLDLEESS